MVQEGPKLPEASADLGPCSCAAEQPQVRGQVPWIMGVPYDPASWGWEELTQSLGLEELRGAGTAGGRASPGRTVLMFVTGCPPPPQLIGRGAQSSWVLSWPPTPIPLGTGR